jgi:hypothetical protein
MITIKNMGALDVAATANEFVRNARRLADAIKVARDPEVQGKLAEDAEMSAAFERWNCCALSFPCSQPSKSPRSSAANPAPTTQ